jgi:hypothetical protein
MTLEKIFTIPIHHASLDQVGLRQTVGSMVCAHQRKSKSLQ